MVNPSCPESARLPWWRSASEALWVQTSRGNLAVMAALLLLGVGWNAGLTGDSTPLRGAPVDPSVPTRAEGLGELGMGAGASG